MKHDTFLTTPFAFSKASSSYRTGAALAWGVLSIAGTFIRIPLPWTIVPITVQPIMGLLAGSVLGPRYGFLSQLIYLLGLPLSAYAGQGYGIFATGIAGYFFGITFASIVTGLLVTCPTITKSTMRITIALWGVMFFCVYVPGMASLYLAAYANGKYLSAASLLSKGALPFIPGDFLKILFSAELTFWYHQLSR